MYCGGLFSVKSDLIQRGSSVAEQKQIMGEVRNTFSSVVLIFYAWYVDRDIRAMLGSQPEQSSMILIIMVVSII